MMTRSQIPHAGVSLLWWALCFIVSCSPTPGSKDGNSPAGKPTLTAKARHESVQLSWSPVDDADKYVIYWSPTQEGTRNMQEVSFETDQVSFNHKGLTNGQTYYYAVAAWKNGRGEKSTVIAATPQSRPDAPQQFTAVAHNSKVTLQWQAVANAEHYYVQTAMDSGVLPAIVDITNTPFFESRQLTNGRRYYFIVTASNTYGDSENSQEIYATPTSFQSVAAGRDHSCALTTDNTVWCWGGNASGQRANGEMSSLPQPVPKQIEDTKQPGEWQSLASGATHNCGIKSDHSLWCWGNNKAGQLAIDLAIEASPYPQQETTHNNDWSTRPNALALGSNFSCALKLIKKSTGDENTLWCWGSNTYSPSTSTKNPQPAQVGSTSDWVAITAGTHHACGIRSNGELLCWGDNSTKQLGRGEDNSVSLDPNPQRVNETGPWRAVSAGLSHTCAIKSDESLWCWGNNYKGAVGNGELPNTSQRKTHAQPLPIGINNKKWRALAAGMDHTCAIDSDDTLWCWGSNIYGQLGNNTTQSLSEPTAIGLTLIDTVTAGTYHTCAFNREGTMYCWGYNASGQLGNGQVMPDATQPVQIAKNKTDWQSVFAGSDRSCAIDTTQTLWCWGHNDPVEFNTGSTTSTAAPGVVIDIKYPKDNSGWSSVALGAPLSKACGVKRGERRCWENGSWSAADGATSWGQVAAGSFHFCAIQSGGALLCWGLNFIGQLGNSTAINCPPSIPGCEYPLNNSLWVGASTDRWDSIVARGSFSCALNKNQSLQCWGKNDLLSPQLTSRPTAVNNDTDWATIAVGESHICGLKNGGTLLCWGSNGVGQLGVILSQTPQITPDKAKPVQTVQNNVTQWSNLMTGDRYTCAANRNDGGLWCWGENDNGQLGYEPRGWQSVPDKVMNGLTHFTVDVTAQNNIAAGTSHTCAIRAVERTLWCWGNNNAGQRGDGSAWKETPQAVYFPQQ